MQHYIRPKTSSAHRRISVTFECQSNLPFSGSTYRNNDVDIDIFTTIHTSALKIACRLLTELIVIVGVVVFFFVLLKIFAHE